MTSSVSPSGASVSGVGGVSDVVAAKEAIAGLHAALDVLGSLDLSGVAGEDLAGFVEDLYVLDARLAGERAAVLRAVDGVGAWESSGARSAAMWVATRTRVPKGRAASELRLARRLGSLGVTDGALREGAITVDAARLLADCGSGRTAAAFDERAEAHLVGEACRHRYRDFKRICDYWAQVVDPDGTDDDAEARHARRGVSCSQLPDGSHRLDGTLDVVGGTEFSTELARRYQALLDAELADLRAHHGPGASLELLARSPRQRRHDALVEMARRSAATPAGARKPRPLVTVHVGFETFAGRVLETLNRTVIAPVDLARVLDGADVERVVFDSPSRVLDVGVTRRFFTGATRRAVEVRDRQCTHPYCDEPYDRCDIDHRHPHSHGGPTTQANGRPRCPPHNPEVNGRPPPGPDPP
jgi:hypothetical protein